MRRGGASVGGGGLLVQPLIKIQPLRIVGFNQLQLPRPPPALDPLLASDGFSDRVMRFVPDQSMDVVGLGEAWYGASPMFIDAPSKIIGHPDVQGSVSLTGQNIDVELTVHLGLGRLKEMLYTNLNITRNPGRSGAAAKPRSTGTPAAGLRPPPCADAA